MEGIPTASDWLIDLNKMEHSDLLIYHDKNFWKAERRNKLIS